jgi:transcriptional regulator
MLTDKQRIALELNRRGMTHKEIAKLMGRRRSSVSYLIRRARRTVEKVERGMAGSSSAEALREYMTTPPPSTKAR